jgi:hypothetical protein
MSGLVSASTSLQLRAGELVEVRSAEDILATLDARGRFEGLPFMPEMLQHCGKQFRVFKRADKNCDRIHGKGLIRKMNDAVHLDMLRCDGQAHDACEAGCLIFWKEAWLTRASAERETAASAPRAAVGQFVCTMDDLRTATRAPQQPVTGGPTYSCQATEQLAYSVPLPEGDGHYIKDVRCGNASWRQVLRTIVIERFNEFQRKRDGLMYPRVFGTLKKTPASSKGLQPGDLVRVKTREEILATLDVRERNRGLSFDKEMVKFCGDAYKVLRRVKNIIEEKSGRMLTMKGDCIILDGAACEGDYNKLCPRAIYPYWRELWLEPIDPNAPRQTAYRNETFRAFLLSLAWGSVTKAVARRRPRQAPERPVTEP